MCSYRVAVFFSRMCFEIALYIPLKLPKLKTWRLLACFDYVAAVYVIKTVGAVDWTCSANVKNKKVTFLFVRNFLVVSPLRKRH